MSATTTRHNRNTDSLHVSAHDAQTVNFLDDYPNTIIGNGYSSDGASSTLPFEESYWSIPVDYQCDTSYTDLLTGSSNPSTYTNSPVSQDDELKPYLNPPIHDRSLPTNQPEMRAWPQYRNNGSDYPVTNPFDIFKALDLLFSRAAPLFNLNNMVESQSFLITENWLPGSPIAYVSEGFEALTGYDRTEVIGKNPRFLQSPDGKAEPDSRRDLAVGSSAQELKEKIALGREVQHGIMNYRKNGEPIMIVLTLIPIPWDASGVIRFWFGFQNELLQGQAPFRLVLSPNEQGSLLHRRSRAISSGNSSSLCDASAIDTDETPVMNVVLGGTSPDVPHAGMSSASPEQYYEHQYGSSVTSPSYLLPALANAVGEDQKKQLLSSNAWNNMILENLDGFVQILSLKGTIVHLSPACSKLWYNASQLLGSSVETICHPSDVLAVRRELKHASSNKEIDMVFRIKHKNGDHFWYHNYGSVWNDGTRRWAVLVGRQLDMFSLGSEAMSQRGGFGDRDIWMKISTSGLILSAFPNPQPALGMTVRELIGTSFQNLLDTDFPPDRFQRLLQSARRGNVASTSVVLQSSRGHRLNAEMTLHPGGAPESAKAYFLLAQCSIKAVIRKGMPFPSKSCHSANSSVQELYHGTLLRQGPSNYTRFRGRVFRTRTSWLDSNPMSAVYGCTIYTRYRRATTISNSNCRILKNFRGSASAHAYRAMPSVAAPTATHARRPNGDVVQVECEIYAIPAVCDGPSRFVETSQSPDADRLVDITRLVVIS